MKNGILVVGSVNHDSIYKVADLPRPHQTIAASHFTTAPGGKGANQAVASALATTGTVTLLGCVGSDLQAQMCLSYLEANKVDVSALTVLEDTPTGTACIMVEASGQNLIVISGGANAKVSVADIERAQNLFEQRSVVLLQLEIPMQAVRRSLELARAARAISILNPAPFVAGVEKIVSLADIVTPNQAEASALAGIHVTDETSACEASKHLLEMGVGTAIITLGSEGSFVASQTEARYLPPYRIKSVVDTTGAGDVYNGALAAALNDGADVFAAADFASAAASMSVMQPTASNCAPSKTQVIAFQNEQHTGKTGG